MIGAAGRTVPIGSLDLADSLVGQLASRRLKRIVPSVSAAMT